MYKVLLVDDEPVVLDGLKRRVHWADLGLEVVGTSSDGLDAVRKIEQLKPDIVITDIIMPVMDGIKLIETIRELGFSVKIIMLSGHDDFTYAQKAIRLGAVEYQLKPVSSEEIESSLKRITEQLDVERVNLKKYSVMEESSRHNAETMKKYMLTDIATGKADHLERLISEVGMIDRESLNSQFIVSLMTIDRLGGQTGQFSENDADLTVFLALNISNEIIGGNNTNFAVKFSDNRIVLFTLFPLQWSEEQISASIHWMFALIQENIAKYLGCSATIGVGTVVQKIEDIHKSYQTALDTMQNRIFFAPGALIFFADIEARQQGDPVRKVKIPAELQQAVRDLDLGKIESSLDSIFSGMVGDGTTGYDVLIQTGYKILLEATSLITSSGRDEDLKNPATENEVRLLDRLRTFISIDDLKVWILEYFKLMISIVNNGTKKQGGLVSSHMISFIEANYQSDISLTDLAAKLFMSANYLSSLFKKETGVSFKRYLNDFRLEKSKQYLKNPAYKIYQVANLVGYESEEHFSRLFKSRFGMTCTEFREQNS